MKLILYFVHEVEIFLTIFEKTETATQTFFQKSIFPSSLLTTKGLWKVNLTQGERTNRVYYHYS